MKRLGGALTPTLLWTQQSPGFIDLDDPILVCETTDFLVEGFPRQAFVDFVFAGRAVGEADFLAEARVTFNSGADWMPLTALPVLTAVPANRWAATRGSQIVDLSVGQTARFGIRIVRSGGSTANLIASDCAIRVLVGNRNGTSSPYDQR